MYQQDYILRLIEQVGAVFRRMIKAITNGRSADAVEMAESAIELVSDTSIGLIDSLTAEGIIALLGAGGILDSGRCAMLAVALERRADAFEADGRITAAAAQREKAAVLMAAARAEDPGIDELLVILAREGGY